MTAAQEHRWRALAVLAAGLSLIVLDGTIVGVALPAIIDDLGLDLTDAQWVNSLYAVVFAAFLLTFGRLGDRLGRRVLFAAGIAVFMLGSATAALASDAPGLIASRALQGVGGAMILPSTLSTVNATFRGRDRAAAFGVWGAVVSGMAAVGPLLGGVLVTFADWRWIFFVNLPLGVLVLVGTALWVPETRGRVVEPGWDVVGLATSAAGFGLLVFGLIEASQYGWWTPLADLEAGPLTWPATAPISVAPVALGVGAWALVGFVAWEGHRARIGRSALLDLSLFRLASFSWGNLTAATVAAGEFALVFAIPLFLINVQGLDALGAGLVMAAMALGAFVSGAAARHLAARLTPPGVVVVGLGLELVGVALTAAAVVQGAPPWRVALAMVCYGVGLGLASAQLTSTVLVGVPTELSGSASATQSTVRQVGAALGTALAGTQLAAGLAMLLPARLAEVPGLDPTGVAELAEATVVTVGANIQPLRGLGSGGEYGALTPAIADALVTGFSQAIAGALVVAAVFLVLGLVGSVMVVRAARRLGLHAPDAP